MATLSVLYIVRNEEETIRKSMSSVAAVADEFIVVDCGSKDKTVAECRAQKNVKVFQHAWVHDYSKMRNFGLQYCSSDWVMYLDGDEMIDRKSLAAVHQAIENAQDFIFGFCLHIVDHPEKWEFTDPGTKSFFKSPQLRVFRRNPRIVFSGAVGESVEPAIAAMDGAIDVINASVHHHLWRGRGVEYGKMKIKYYQTLGSPIPQPTQLPEARDEEPPPPGADLAIAMLGFNCAAHTRRALESLQRTVDVPHTFHFVDNGSTDNTQQVVHEFPNAVLTSRPRNDGVAKSRNMCAKAAMSAASTKWICFLDNDVVLTSGWIKEMIRVMEADPAVAIVGPATNTGDGPQNISKRFNTKGDPERVAEALSGQAPDVTEVDRLDGFCILVRTDAMRRIGYFDEMFGIYGNECHDLCLRARQAGFKVAMANKVFVEHVGRTTIRENQMYADWHHVMLTSNNRFMHKWAAAPQVPMGRGGVPRAPMALQAAPGSHAPKTKFSVIVLTHNRMDVTRECLDSVAAHTKDYELIVVDNGSTDGTLSYVESAHPLAKIIRNRENLGIPKARNQGIRAASADFLILMDNDIVVHQGWTEELMNGIRSGASIAGIEAWQLDASHAACHKCLQPNERVDYLGGACCLFERKVFETVGLLDEGFSPAYYEDPDICVRAKKTGMRLAWTPTPRIKHKEHATLVHGQKTFDYKDALARSHERFAAKMRGEIKVEHEKLAPRCKRLRIIYLAMQYDYGVKDRGLSFEHDNFFPAFDQWEHTDSLLMFDYVEISQKHGVQKMSEMLYDTVQRFAPDAIFGVWFNEQHDPQREMLRKISKTTPAKTVGWFCDSHWRYDNFDRAWAPHLDFCVTTSTVAHEKYVRDGFGNKVIKSQWGASPKYRRFPGITKDVSVSFVGQPHGDRRAVIERVKSAGINVNVHGSGWGNRLSFDEMVLMFNRSRINLNLNNACDASFKQIKGRNFEVPACGGFLLTGVAENLGEYYEFGKEIATYSNTDDMIDKIKHYTANGQEADAIAEAGYARTMRDHTYASRFKEIFAKAGLI